jgi:hypothetical protein
LPPHRDSNIGLLPLFKKAEERKIEKWQYLLAQIIGE